MDGSNRVTLRNRKHLRIIGYVKPRDPFPMSVVPTVPSGEKMIDEIPTRGIQSD